MDTHTVLKFSFIFVNFTAFSVAAPDTYFNVTLESEGGRAEHWAYVTTDFENGDGSKKFKFLWTHNEDNNFSVTKRGVVNKVNVRYPTEKLLSFEKKYKMDMKAKINEGEFSETNGNYIGKWRNITISRVTLDKNRKIILFWYDFDEDAPATTMSAGFVQLGSSPENPASNQDTKEIKLATPNLTQHPDQGFQVTAPGECLQKLHVDTDSSLPTATPASKPVTTPEANLVLQDAATNRKETTTRRKVIDVILSPNAVNTVHKPKETKCSGSTSSGNAGNDTSAVASRPNEVLRTNSKANLVPPKRSILEFLIQKTKSLVSAAQTGNDPRLNRSTSPPLKVNDYVPIHLYKTKSELRVYK